MTAELGNGYQPTEGVQSYLSGRVYLKKCTNGDVEILTGPHSLTLGGKYQVGVTLSKDEMLRLFADAYKDESFLTVVALLAKALGKNGDAEKTAATLGGRGAGPRKFVFGSALGASKRINTGG